jgi:hypothetical protein
MSLEDFTLTEISQSEKDKFCMNPLHKVSKIVKLIERENGMTA